MAKKLYLVFELNNQKNFTIALANPKDDLGQEDVAPVMSAIVTNDIFKVGTARITSAKDAYIRETTTTDVYDPAA